MEFDQAIGQMYDVTALLTARLHDDRDAGIAIVQGAEGAKIARLLFGMTDLTLAIIRLVCGITGSSPEVFLQNMGQVTAKLESKGGM